MRCHVQQRPTNSSRELFLDDPKQPVYLSSQSKSLNNLMILLDIAMPQIIEQFSSTRDHFQ